MVVEKGHQYRPTVKKDNGADVPATLFLEPSYKHISAIWAVDLNGSSSFGVIEPTALVHNPLADVPIPQGLFSADEEFVVMQHGDNVSISRLPKNT